MNIDEYLNAIGSDSPCLVFVDRAVNTSSDAYCQELMERAVAGHPVISAGVLKPWDVLSRDLLHAQARIPAEQSSISMEELERVMTAADVINQLSIDLVGMVESQDEFRQILYDASRRTPLPVIGVDLRAPKDTLPVEPTMVWIAQLLRKAQELGLTVLLAVGADTCAKTWEDVHGK